MKNRKAFFESTTVKWLILLALLIIMLVILTIKLLPALLERAGLPWLG